MEKLSLVYVTYDGVLNEMCGVGALTSTFIKSFPEIQKLLLKNDIDVTLNLLTIALTESADGFSREKLLRSKEIARASGGDVYFIINDTQGDSEFGSLENWKVASISAATKILELAQESEKTLVYCVDTPFMHVPYYVKKQINAYKNKEIKFLLAIHSDVLIHHPNNPDKNRLTWEAEALNFAKVNNDTYIGKTSEFMKDHLIRHYQISLDKFIDLQTGILPTDNKYSLIDKCKIQKKLSEYNIPLDKDLIFSVGRAVEYKGFELLIDAFSRINHSSHLVFIASPYNSPHCNVSAIKSTIKKAKICCTPIFALDFELPGYICQHENTKIVAQLAKHEPFGLVPEDTRMWARNAGPVPLASNCEGFIEQITDSIDGFLVDIDSADKVARTLDDILDLSENQNASIRHEGFETVLHKYDYRISILKSIYGLINKPYNDTIEKDISYDNIF